MSTQTGLHSSISVQTQTEGDPPVLVSSILTASSQAMLSSSSASVSPHDHTSAVPAVALSPAPSTPTAKVQLACAVANEEASNFIGDTSQAAVTSRSQPAISISNNVQRAQDSNCGSGGIGQYSIALKVHHVAEEPASDMASTAEILQGKEERYNVPRVSTQEDATEEGGKREHNQEGAADDFVANSAVPVQPLELAIELNPSSSSNVSGRGGGETFLAAYDPAPGNTTQDKPALHAISEVVINSNDCNASLNAHSVPLLSLSFGKTRGTPKLHVALQPPSIDTVPTQMTTEGPPLPNTSLPAVASATAFASSSDLPIPDLTVAHNTDISPKGQGDSRSPMSVANMEESADEDKDEQAFLLHVENKASFAPFTPPVLDAFLSQDYVSSSNDSPVPQGAEVVIMKRVEVEKRAEEERPAEEDDRKVEKSTLPHLSFKDTNELVGSAVEIKGLVKAAHYNSLRGAISKILPNNRVIVTLPLKDGQKDISVNLENLLRLPFVGRSGELGRAERVNDLATEGEGCLEIEGKEQGKGGGEEQGKGEEAVKANVQSTAGITTRITNPRACASVDAIEDSEEEI